MLSNISNTTLTKLEKINNNVVIIDKSYRLVNSKILNIYHQVKQYLPDDKIDLLNNLEELYNIEEIILEKIIYDETKKENIQEFWEYKNIG